MRLKSLSTLIALENVIYAINNGSTSHILYISHQYLSSDTYAFELELTNFLGYSTVSSVLSITVFSYSVPLIDIDGGSEQIMYPYSALSLHVLVRLLLLMWLY